MWIYGSIGGDGGLTLRLPTGCDSDPSKVTGEVTFAEGGCAAWANITKFMPCVDNEGKEYWGVEVDEWLFGNGDGDEISPGSAGHQLASTVQEDDDGNPYIVFTMSEGWGSEESFSFMVGKRRWVGGGRTKGDIRRLGLRDDSPIRNEGVPIPEIRPLGDGNIAIGIHDKKAELGLECVVRWNPSPGL